MASLQEQQRKAQGEAMAREVGAPEPKVQSEKYWLAHISLGGDPENYPLADTTS